jgi:hypothetical protein
VVEQYGGEVAKDPGAIKAEFKIDNIDSSIAMPEKRKSGIKSVKEKYLSVAMVTAADKSRYGRYSLHQCEWVHQSKSKMQLDQDQVFQLWREMVTSQVIAQIRDKQKRIWVPMWHLWWERTMPTTMRGRTLDMTTSCSTSRTNM